MHEAKESTWKCIMGGEAALTNGHRPLCMTKQMCKFSAGDSLLQFKVLNFILRKVKIP